MGAAKISVGRKVEADGCEIHHELYGTKFTERVSIFRGRECSHAMSRQSCLKPMYDEHANAVSGYQDGDQYQQDGQPDLEPFSILIDGN